MFLTILAGLAATFAYIRIGHWVGRCSLDVWKNVRHFRDNNRFVLPLLFPVTSWDRSGCTETLGMDCLEEETYLRLMLFFWPIKVIWNAGMLALIAGVEACYFGAEKVLGPLFKRGFKLGFKLIFAAVDHLFISGPDKLVSGVKKLARPRKQMRELQPGEKPFESSAAAFCAALKKAE